LNNLSKWWRGLGLLVVLLAAIGFTVSACGSSTSSSSSASATTASTPQMGGTYNFPLQANPVSIEPLNAQESEGVQVCHQIFQGLMTYQLQPDGSMKAVPELADPTDPYTVNANATVFTFHLRHGIMFQAPVNREVTAQDFVNSWNRVTNPKNQSAVSYILAPVVGANASGYAPKGLTGVKALDKYTLQVTLQYPFAEFPQTLGHPVTAVTPVDYINKVGNTYFANHPVGTGPYMLKSWVQNQSVTLVKNPTYWDKTSSGPYIDTINMPIITDSSTEWLEFQKGQLDYSVVPPGSVAAAMANPNVKSGAWTAKKWASIAVYFIGINMDNPVLGNNLALRQALAYSTDQKDVINVVNEGVGIPATGFVPPGVPGFRPNQSPYTYNLAKAKALIQAMSPAPPTLSYWYNTDEGHQKIAEVLQAGWQQAGINVKLSNFEWGTFLSKLAAGNSGSGSQLFRMGWIADYPSMDDFLYPLFQSSQSLTGSYTFYKNPKFDALLLQARQTVDTTQRENLYAQAEKMVLADVPAIPLYFYQDFRVTNNRVHNFVLDPMGLVNMWSLWIK
jgi:peptide/nickel transport system substrate-binding protein/oligopeptide transport system substrate-binding protein